MRIERANEEGREGEREATNAIYLFEVVRLPARSEEAAAAVGEAAAVPDLGEAADAADRAAAGEIGGELAALAPCHLLRGSDRTPMAPEPMAPTRDTGEPAGGGDGEEEGRAAGDRAAAEIRDGSGVSARTGGTADPGEGDAMRKCATGDESAAAPGRYTVGTPSAESEESTGTSRGLEAGETADSAAAVEVESDADSAPAAAAAATAVAACAGLV